MKTTESDSSYDDLEKMEVGELLRNINQEDQTVAASVARSLHQIEALVNAIIPGMRGGGRLFYIGAGTSGRLGIVDASECPPTFGVPHGMVIGLMAGGDKAIRKAVEFAEDDITQGWKDLQAHDVSRNDFVIGIAASGSTPYVTGAIEACNTAGIVTGCITCNAGSALAKISKFPVEVVVGPEFVTGSTRMKSGTAQKMVLNMVSTAVMIQLGRVKGNKMVDMQLTNNKLVDRGTKMVMKNTGITNYSEANALLMKAGSVRKATEMYLRNNK